jgi:hypothetical protein
MTSTIERSKSFIQNDYDISTKIMTLLFVKNELNRIKETEETLYLKNMITNILDTLVDH